MSKEAVLVYTKKTRISNDVEKCKFWPEIRKDTRLPPGYSPPSNFVNAAKWASQPLLQRNTSEQIEHI